MNQIKTAILGGSFDPVHLGHLFLLHNALTLSDYRCFIVIPAALSNFKQDSRPVVESHHRLRMIELAIEDYEDLYPADDARIIVSDTEIKRGGISYTIDTVLEIKKEYGIQSRLGLIIGDDHIRKLKDWHQFNRLINEVEFLICPRSENPEIFSEIPDGVVYQKLETSSVAVENSTEIRNNPNGFSGYLSERVREYVGKNNLYS